MTVAPEVLLGRDTIAESVDRLGAAISRDHPDGVLLVAVLKGALIFLADLVRTIDVDVTVDFLAISRYAPDSGRVRILKDLDLEIAGHDVVVVEDLVDTGLTLAYLLGHLRDRAPRRLRTCTLLDRPGRRIVPQHVEYVGTTIPDVFVLGYGMHWHDRYRNLDQVYVADRETVVADPDCYVEALYGGGGSEKARW